MGCGRGVNLRVRREMRIVLGVDFYFDFFFFYGNLEWCVGKGIGWLGGLFREFYSIFFLSKVDFENILRISLYYVYWRVYFFILRFL